MTRVNGRPFGFLALLVGGWLCGRLWLTDGPMPNPSVLISADAKAAAEAATDGPDAEVSMLLPASPPTRFSTPRARAILSKSASQATPQDIGTIKQPAGTPSAIMPMQTAFAAPFADISSAPALPTAPPPKAKALNIYAYSFWRFDNGIAGLASAGQYGGSQSGIIATWDIGSVLQPFERVSLLARISAAHDDRQDREAALGLRWQPLADLPVSLSAERRFRPHGPDRFAMYAAGGVDDTPLPAGFDLDLYGQAGWASGSEGSWFFDASARAQRPMVEIGKLKIAGGGGIWTGGQKGAQRVDIGPALRTDLMFGKTPFTISADWRFRMAGDAQPGNGPALTLSTAF